MLTLESVFFVFLNDIKFFSNNRAMGTANQNRIIANNNFVFFNVVNLADINNKSAMCFEKQRVFELAS